MLPHFASSSFLPPFCLTLPLPPLSPIHHTPSHFNHTPPLLPACSTHFSLIYAIFPVSFQPHPPLRCILLTCISSHSMLNLESSLLSNAWVKSQATKAAVLLSFWQMRKTQRVACDSLQNMARENDLRRMIPESQMKRTAVTLAGTVLRTFLNSLMR